MNGDHQAATVTSLDTALDRAEAEILTRTRLIENTAGHHTPAPFILAVTTPADSQRLQAAADLGASLGIIVLVLGPWPPGITCTIGTDGRIHEVHSQQDHDWTATLPGLRVVRPGDDDVRVLLALLEQSDTSGSPSSPDAPVTAATPPLRHPEDAAATTSPRPWSQALHESRDNRILTAPPTDRSEVPDGTEIAHLLNPEADPARNSSDSIATRLTPHTVPELDEQPRGHQPSTVTTNQATAVQPSSVAGVRLRVLGRLALLFQPEDSDSTEITTALAPKQREILIYLALYRDGIRRDTLAAALWPNASPDRPYNTFHATLSQMRRSVRMATNMAIDTLTAHHDGHYQLAPDVVDVDLWHLQDALRTRTAAADRTAALWQVADLYHGELAEGLHTEWLQAPREALRRDVLDALSTLIHTVRDDDPNQAVELLEQARQIDPQNEAIYRDIMRIQATLGHQDSVHRTLDLLTSTLREIDAAPSPRTQALADQLLQQPHRTVAGSASAIQRG